METLTIVVQTLLAVVIPILTVWGWHRSALVRAISPVLLCYGAGMLLGNLPYLRFSVPAALTTCNVAVGFAIPLLLFSVNVRAWLKLARTTSLAFGFAILGTVVSAIGAHALLGGSIRESAELSGMFTGVYIGGTPNMAAIGKALGVHPETLVLANAADMVASFAYLLFMLTIAQRTLLLILPSFKRGTLAEGDEHASRMWRHLPGPLGWAKGLGLAALVVAASFGAGQLTGETFRGPVIILTLSTLAVGLSAVPRVRDLPGTHDMGQFLLLVFCVAMGYTADFGKLFSGAPLVIALAGLIILGTLVIQVALCALFRIDADTAIITSVAGIFGPHMIGPVAVALRNREVIFSGIVTGLIGYALANYLGLAVTWLLR